MYIMWATIPRRPVGRAERGISKPGGAVCSATGLLVLGDNVDPPNPPTPPLLPGEDSCPDQSTGGQTEAVSKWTSLSWSQRAKGSPGETEARETESDLCTEGQTVSVKNQVSKYFWLYGPLGPVATIQLCCCRAKEPWTICQWMNLDVFQ